MNQIINNIKTFISEVKKDYQNIYIDYTYNQEDEVYEIWHNREDLEYSDTDFRHLTGKLLTELFLNKNIVNIYITYNHEKSAAFFLNHIQTGATTHSFTSQTNIKQLFEFCIEDQRFIRTLSTENRTITQKENSASLKNNFVNLFDYSDIKVA